jgi:hypothetical protein
MAYSMQCPLFGTGIARGKARPGDGDSFLPAPADAVSNSCRDLFPAWARADAYPFFRPLPLYPRSPSPPLVPDRQARVWRGAMWTGRVDMHRRGIGDIVKLIEEWEAVEQ